MKLPKFISVTFYPAYETPSVAAPGRYVALGEDGKVYVVLMDGQDTWQLLGRAHYE